MQKLDLKLAGLYTNPNNWSEVPQGALQIADNVVIEKESVVETRRGQKAYGSTLTTDTGSLDKIFNYRGSLILSYNGKLAYDPNNDGTWVDYSGTYQSPDSRFKIQGLQANNNFYFTSSEGIYKLDSINSTPVRAGAPKALGGSASLTGSTGFLPDDRQVAYRIVWGYTDLNGNLILGNPSQRILVSNSTAGTRNVNITFQIPDTITTRWFYQIYRSGESATAASEPNDEMQLVYEDNPTPAEITAKSITVEDITPNDLKKAFLYTSPSQQGIENANDVPPLSKDLAVFKNHTFYANCKLRQRFSFDMLSAGTPRIGYYSDQGNTTNASSSLTSLSDTTDIRVGMRVIGTGIPDDTVVVSVDSATAVTISNDATVTDTAVNMEFQDRISIGDVDYWAGSSKDVSDNQFLVDTSGTPAENIENTAKNLIEVINKSTDNTEIYGYYMSNFNELPGQILLEERALGGDSFALTSTYPESFSPRLPNRNAITGISAADPSVITSAAHGLTTGDTVSLFQTNSTPALSGTYTVTVIDTDTFSVPAAVTSVGTSGYWVDSNLYQASTNEERANRVYISKKDQPESVPRYRLLEVGSRNDPILRIVPLRDSLFIFKEDGIYRISGETQENFRVQLFEGSMVLQVIESPQVLNNQVFCFTDQGIVAIAESGAAVMSRAIEGTLIKLLSPDFNNFDQSFGVAYESARSYIFFTVRNKLDEYPTQAFVYNTLTDSWTRWALPRSCGILKRQDDKLYFGNPANDKVYQERKDFSLDDYADEEYDVTITDIDEFSITLSDVSDVEVGMTLGQSQRNAVITAIDGNVLTVNRLLSYTTGAAKVYNPILTKIQWVANSAENPGILKQFREMSFIFRDAAFNSVDVGFSTNFSSAEIQQNLTTIGQGAFGDFAFGSLPFGGGLGGEQILRCYIPLEKQRGSWLNVSVSLEQAFTSFSLTGASMVFNNMTERFR